MSMFAQLTLKSHDQLQDENITIIIIIGLVGVATPEIISTQPQDNFAFQNQTVIFECGDDDVQFPPVWRINGDFYYRTHLPKKYTYLPRKLIFFEVLKSDDYNTYQCAFSNGSYSSISRIAILEVYQGESIS